MREALEALRVPIEVTGAGAFGESEEVRELALLSARWPIRRMRSRSSACCAGRSSACSDRDLFAFRQAGGYFIFFARSTTGRAPAAARVASPPSNRCAAGTGGRACCRPARRSSASSRIPAISRSPPRSPAASRPAISCTPSTASARSSRRLHARGGRRGARRLVGLDEEAPRSRRRWIRCRSSPAVPTSCGS